MNPPSNNITIRVVKKYGGGREAGERQRQSGQRYNA